MNRIEIEPVTNALGAVVRGIDVGEPLDAEAVRLLTETWHEHKVLFLPDQPVDREQHKRFALSFGEIYRHPFLKDVGTDPDVVKLYSGGDTGSRYVAEGWHTDVTFTPAPPKGSILRAIEVPRFGGDTMWLDLEAAYAALSPAMQEFASSLTAVHSAPRAAFVRGDTSGEVIKSRHPGRAHASRDRPQVPVREPRVHALDRGALADRVERAARDVPRAHAATRVPGALALGAEHHRDVGQLLHATQGRRRQPQPRCARWNASPCRATRRSDVRGYAFCSPIAIRLAHG